MDCGLELFSLEEETEWIGGLIGDAGAVVCDDLGRGVWRHGVPASPA